MPAFKKGAFVMNRSTGWLVRRMAAMVAVGAVSAFDASAGEPNVVEKIREDGRTELSVVAGDGRVLARYAVDLKTRHEPATEPTDAIRRWEAYRFGGFFCFNDNQYVGIEFSTNKDPKIFHPSDLDVAGWAAAMKEAGMRYAVLTTRHTSGFLLWDSATTEFDVGSSPGAPDVTGEFVKECRRAGIAPGLYYCLWGGGWMPHDNARAIILAQLHELATKFGEIPYFWIDMGFWGPANLSTQEIYDAIKSEQPDAIVIMNQHIQDGSALRYFPTDVVNGEVHLPPAHGHEPYRRVGGKRYYLPLEFEPVSQRMEQGTVTPWGAVGAWFTFGEGLGFPATDPLPVKDVFDWIKEAYDRGAANVLLALSADHTGRMRPDDVRQLVEIGKRLREAGLLEVPDASAAPVSLAMGKPATASGVWENHVPQYGPAAAFDGDLLHAVGGGRGGARRLAGGGSGRDATVSRAVIKEGWDRTRKFAVQYKAGDEWKDAAEGTTLGGKRELKFAPVKARVFRLNITEATDVPTIWEFQLFAE
jgi:hypothetical protein